MENQKYLMEQMRIHKEQSIQAASSKSPLKGTMNEEELMLNKKLLIEISQKRK